MATLSTPEGERASIEAFKRDVIDVSMTSLVILDFWAEWCGPCKQLGPIIEKVAADYAAKGVRLVKIDVDKNQTIAAQFRVQSIPTVYAIFQGQPIADLTPARTERELSAFLDQILPQLPITAADGHDTGLEEYAEAAATAIEAGDFLSAEPLYRMLVEQQPESNEHKIGLARALVGLDRADDAERTLAALPQGSAVAGLAQVRAAIALVRNRVPASTVEALEADVLAAPDDHHKRLKLAAALAANGARDSAADHLLGIIAREPGWNDGAARTELLKLFEAVGLADPWVAATRRKLSAILFT